ncbi:MAG: hypothetical protein ACREBU_12185 [Nitrososphaera sp.]
MKTYRCPVCKKPLTKKEYEDALGILGEREKHLKHEKKALKRQLREARSKMQKAKREGKDEGIKSERARTQRLLKGKEREIGRLKERLAQIKKGTTPQTEGLEFEDKLATRLKREFPQDMIQHKGKGGDVLHIVNFEKKPAGVIIYECKRTPGIKLKHIEQAHRAKQSREADFAVLVTTGHKKGFSGLAQMNGVLVVSPLGTIHLAALLRGHLIEMLRAKINKGKRAVIAHELMKYITSPQFRNPIEEVVHLTSELQDMIKDEANKHYKIWKKRWNYYQTIHWDTSQIRQNLQLVLHGEEPKPLEHQKVPPLQLPEPAE